MTPWTVACQAPLPVDFSRQAYWSGVPFPTPEDLSDPRIELSSLASPAMAGGFFTTSTTWESESRSVVSNSLRPYGLYSPRNSPGQNTGVGSLSLLQGIFPIQGSKPRFSALQADSLPAEPQGKTRILEWVAYPSPGDLSDPEIDPGSLALQVDSLPTELSGKPCLFVAHWHNYIIISSPI